MSVLKQLTDITCRQAEELLSKQMDEPLPLVDRVRLEAHLRACSFCTRVGQQMDFIRKAMRRLGD
jgi:predicted anti-sigma-YlaC factor YlaD